MVNRADFECSLCNFNTMSEDTLNEHIMEKHDNIILKKEADVGRENLECLVEIKQEVEDPLSVEGEDDLKMETDDLEDLPLKAENSDETRSGHGNNSRQRKPASEQVMKLKRARQSRPRAAKNIAVQNTRMLFEAANDLEMVPLKRPVKSVKQTKPVKPPVKAVKKFSCDHCNFKATSRPGLQSHVKSVHLKDLKFLCTACGKRFADQDDLSKHIEKNNITTSDGVWQMACSKFRKVPSDAADYLSPDDATGEMKCIKCEFASDDYKAAKRHVERIHLKLFNRFICNACSQCFSSKEVLAVHLKEDHKDFSLVEKFTIPEEEAVFDALEEGDEDDDVDDDDDDDLEDRPGSPTFECKDCAFTTKFKRNLLRHVAVIHPKDQRFSCEDCGKHFGERHELMKHVRNNTITTEDGLTRMKCSDASFANSRIIGIDDISRFSCDECTFTALSQSAMQKHVLRVHIKPKSLSNFAANEDDDDFDTTNSLADSDASLDDPSYGNAAQPTPADHCCHLCNYSSKTRRNLTRHIRTVHNKGKSFSCSNCSKKFSNKRVLVQHVAKCCKVEKGEDQFYRFPSDPAEGIEQDEDTGDFRCSQCPFQSPEQTEVVNHVQKIHVKIICNFCHAEFASNDDTTDHVCDSMIDNSTNDDSMSNDCSYQSSFKRTMDKNILRSSFIHKERNFLCSECGAQFSEQKSLQYHLEKMKTIGPDGSVVYRCAKFTKLPSMASEHLHKDEASNLFLCNICDYTSASQTDTKRHIQRIHLGEKRFVCNTCNKGFSSQPEVGRHLAREHDDKSLLGETEDPNNLKPDTYKCQQCMYESPSRINVERHFSVVHLKERNYQCTECGQRYSDKKTLLLHVEKNTITTPDGKTVLQCTKFTKLPSRAGEHLRKDEETHLYHCVLCNYSAKNQSGAKRHVERMHLKEKRFVCNTCSAEFLTKKELAYHLGTEHNDLSLCENEEKLLSLKPEALQCEYCEYSSTVRQYLERHVKVVHLKERNFVCSECGFAFSEKKSLQSHIDRNTVSANGGEAVLQCSMFKKLPSSAGEHIAKDGSTNEFYCLQCSYRSKCPSDTKRHVERMHLKLKKFVCKLCDKGFSSKPNFYLHLATDHGDRSLIAQRPNIAKRLELHHCQFCSYSTKYPKDIQRHFNSIHNKERQSFFCDRCDKKFADKRGLMRHLRANH